MGYLAHRWLRLVGTLSKTMVISVTLRFSPSEKGEVTDGCVGGGVDMAGSTFPAGLDSERSLEAGYLPLIICPWELVI